MKVKVVATVSIVVEVAGPGPVPDVGAMAREAERTVGGKLALQAPEFSLVQVQVESVEP